MRLLVIGGAGYIGSVVTARLIADGHHVAVLDDLSTGHADAVPAGADFVQGDVREAGAPLAGGIDAVLHFAAKSLLGESVEHPNLYWRNNLGGTLALLEAMRLAGVGRIVFSSTAAVYGEPEKITIEDTAPTRPASPYGASKLAVDIALAEHARLSGFGAVSLRYFNVAGAQRYDAGGWLGERHAVETHLIPNILAVALRGTGQVRIYDDDHPTPDGTCIRDYIHVTDLAAAHVLAVVPVRPASTRYTTWAAGRDSQPRGADGMPGRDGAADPVPDHATAAGRPGRARGLVAADYRRPWLAAGARTAADGCGRVGVRLRPGRYLMRTGPGSYCQLRLTGVAVG